MFNPDQSDYWTPHPSSQPILLPPIPSPSTSSSKTRIKSLSSTTHRWLTGHTLDDIVDVEPEIVHAYEKRWQFKWDHYSKIVMDELDRSTARMSAGEVKERAKWLASDFERLNDRFIHLDIKQSQPELTTGRVFCLSLIEDSRVDLYSVTSDQLLLAKESLKKVEMVNQFITQSIAQIIEKHNLSVVMAKLRTEDSRAPQPRTLIPSGGDSANASNFSVARPIEQVDTYYPLSPIQHQAIPDTGFPLPTPVTMPEPRRRTVGLPFGPPYPDDTIALPFSTTIPQANPLGQSYSAVSSHKTTLGALLTMSFFGASITWSTIFSGTRGNIILIAWSACVFIVATACAASASLLVVSEEAIVEKHPPVRWVVRILSRISSLHVFAGLMLLSVAVLVLDPSVEDVVGNGGRGAVLMKVAGSYALVMSTVAMVIAVAVWRRYTLRRWHN